MRTPGGADRERGENQEANGDASKAYRCERRKVGLRDDCRINLGRERARHEGEWIDEGKFKPQRTQVYSAARVGRGGKPTSISVPSFLRLVIMKVA